MDVASVVAVLLLLVAAPCSSSSYKRAACEIICKSQRLAVVKRLCACPAPSRHNYLADLLPHDALVDKRWGLDMELDQGWTGGEGSPHGFDGEDDARKIFRFGKKRSGLAKKWSLDDDLSMALPWEQMVAADGASMGLGDDNDRAGGKIFRFGKKRSVRSAGRA